MTKKKSPEPEFDFVIARPWDEDEPDNLCVYAYGTEMQRGTMKEAQSLLAYVKRQSDSDEKDYSIYRLTFRKIS